MALPWAVDATLVPVYATLVPVSVPLLAEVRAAVQELQRLALMGQAQQVLPFGWLLARSAGF